jgi:cytosine/adenosine deaminase-related metal-dependent hydrolase
MAAAGMKLTWSPASNVALYGTTTDIPSALKAGVVVSLGPDWSMGGSQNLLDEFRFADNWDNTHWSNVITPQMLVQMATKNSAAALGMANILGRVEATYYADLFVVGGDPSAPFDSIIASTPKDVRLVMIGGKILYGDSQLKPAAPQNPVCEDLNLCQTSKFICVAESSSADKLNQTFDQIQTALNSALTDMDSVSGSSYKFAPVAPLYHCP